MAFLSLQNPQPDPDGVVRDAGEAEFTSAFENAAIGMVIVAPDSRRLRVNKAFCQLLGYSERELLALGRQHLTHPDDVAQDLEQRDQCLAGLRDTYYHEKRYLHRDGGIVWGHLTCTLVRDPSGRPVHFISQVQDISERKEAEQALHITEKRLRDTQALLQVAAQIGRLGAWAYEVGQPKVKWSEEVCAIHEVKQGCEPTPEEAVAFFAPEYRDMLRSRLRALRDDGSPCDLEAQLITAKGRRIWVRIIGEAQWDAQGRVRRLQGACQDISESRREAEETRAMAERLTTTLESLTDAFFTLDREWRFTYVNAEAERSLNRTRAELIGVKVWRAFPDLKETIFVENYLRAMNENVAVQFEAYYAPASAWAQIKVYPSKQGLAVYAKDVTDLVVAQREILRLNAELEERVAQRTAQLEAANKELEAFSYSIAHDLRAPLSSIDGFSKMLEETAGASLPQRCKHYLSRIKVGVKQMGELTDGLLALSSLSRASLHSEPVDLAALARAAAAGCQARAPERSVEWHIAANLPVRGDPRLLSQVIGNLVGNAWKFTGRMARARIEVGSMQGPTGRPVYFVKDNGAGFDMAYAGKMFDAFQRVHSTTEFEGTGIGLAIANKAIARHGGRVWAESAPDEGATFFFTLGQGSH